MPVANPSTFNRALQLRKPDLHECITDLNITARIVDRLRQSKDVKVASYMSEQRDFKRLFSPSAYFSSFGRRVPAHWDLDSPKHALAMAVYIFRDAKAKETNCEQCSKYTGPRPAPACLVFDDGDGVLKGACSNCYYSGGECNYVVETHRKQYDEKEEKIRREWVPPTMEVLYALSTTQLEDLRVRVENAFEQRE